MANCEEAVFSNGYADYIVEYSNDETAIEGYFPGDCYILMDENFATVYAERSPDRLPAIPTNEPLLLNATPKLYGLMDTASMDASGITEVADSSVYGYEGTGNLICIIDTGIEYQADVFLNEDGSSRIVALWDQTIRQGNSPQPFGFGAEYSNQDINAALSSENPLLLVSSEDTNGHGTFLASIAAGNVREADGFRGAAPEAELIIVKLKPAKEYLRFLYGVPEEQIAFQENDIMMGIAYGMQVAKRLGRPLSICIGLGTASGGHDGTGMLETMIDSASALPNVFIAAAFGNEGNARLHTMGEASYQELEFNVGTGQKILTMELWGRAPDVYSVGFETPDGAVIDRIPPRFNNRERIEFAVGGTILYVEYTLVDPRSGNERVFIWMYRPLPGLWKLLVYANGTPTPKFNVWMPIRPFVNQDTFFLNSSPDTTLTGPAASDNITSVTAYDYRNNSIALDSSRGYTADNRIKPDLAAPGVEILGVGRRGIYERRSGSSVAAAHVTGAASLMQQWARENTKLTPTGIQIKSYFINGAVRDGRDQWPNPIWGWGRLDVLLTLDNLRRSV